MILLTGTNKLHFIDKLYENRHTGWRNFPVYFVGIDGYSSAYWYKVNINLII